MESLKANQRAKEERVEGVRESTAPVTLLPNEFRSYGADRSLLRVGIMVGEHQAGFFDLSGHPDGALCVAKIVIDGPLQLRGYGKAAMDLVRSIAQKEKYLRLIAHVEPGTPDVMLGRRIFAQKCGFIVHEDDTMEMEIDAGAPSRRVRSTATPNLSGTGGGRK
jgi:hypothetical protein